MLFDTHSPRRRRFVQVIFGTLALLMGGGLVLFGIGGATSGGGLFDAFTNNNTSDIGKSAEKDATKAQKILVTNPKDEPAALKLARARLVIATNDAIDPSTGAVAEEGQPKIDAAVSSWDKYLALGPAKPDASLAIQYATFFAQPAVADYAKAQRAMEAVLVTREPSSGLYSQLTIFALAAGDKARAKEARAQALKLAPSAERRKGIATELDAIEKQINEQIAAQTKAAKESGTDGSTSTTPKLPTLPSLG
jgi:tetratricopeptide (TPR) repeat protein